MIEADFLRQIVGENGIATMLGYVHVHFRPARTAHGWRTPASGEMAAGWPDLTLVRLRDGRLVFVELKGNGTDGKKRGVLDPAQVTVLEWLGRIPGAEVYTWWPTDLDKAARILAR